MSDHPHLLVCHCAQAGVIPPETREAVLRHLEKAGIPFESVADLCQLAASRDPLLPRLANGGPLTIAACHPRAVRWLFNAADAPLPPATTRFLNLRTGNAASLCAELPSAAETPERPSEAAPPSEKGSAWYPVIDHDRCTQCMQCLGFCLFGVYGVNSQRQLRVVAPEQCKPNCPACARVCPETAIIFPKHNTGPINGEEIAPGANQEPIKTDISALLGGNLYATLKQRNTSPRFSPDRDPATALQERRHHLLALAQTGEIPPEILAALPPPEELARLSAEAQAKAAQALRPRATE